MGLACRIFLFLMAVGLGAQTPEIVSLERIWQGAKHNAFGDLTRHRNRWVAVFRESDQHVPVNHAGDGKIRVITSRDGKKWTSAALIAEPGVDLRDPHLAVMSDGRLMIVAGGSVYEERKYMGRQPRVMFSRDGVEWTAPARVLEEGHWLWRVTWHNGRGYGVTKYGAISADSADNPKRAALVVTTDGLHYERVAELQVAGIDETTVRFHPNGDIYALARRESKPPNAWIGHAKPPYKEWEWADAGERVGGPNFFVMRDGTIWAGGRHYEQTNTTVLARMTSKSYQPVLTLPSGGDNSYPGFVYHKGLLWMLYYSSHEGATGIYLAKIRLRK